MRQMLAKSRTGAERILHRYARGTRRLSVAVAHRLNSYVILFLSHEKQRAYEQQDHTFSMQVFLAFSVDSSWLHKKIQYQLCLEA